MKLCPNCQTKYPDDANFCPQEGCATDQGPRRLEPIVEAAAAPRYEMQDAARRRAHRRGLARARHADGHDRRVQAGRPGVAADDRRRWNARSAS